MSKSIYKLIAIALTTSVVGGSYGAFANNSGSSSSSSSDDDASKAYARKVALKAKAQDAQENFYGAQAKLTDRKNELKTLTMAQRLLDATHARHEDDVKARNEALEKARRKAGKANKALQDLKADFKAETEQNKDDIKQAKKAAKTAKRAFEANPSDANLKLVKKADKEHQKRIDEGEDLNTGFTKAIKEKTAYVTKRDDLFKRLDAEMKAANKVKPLDEKNLTLGRAADILYHQPEEVSYGESLIIFSKLTAESKKEKKDAVAMADDELDVAAHAYEKAMRKAKKREFVAPELKEPEYKKYEAPVDSESSEDDTPATKRVAKKSVAQTYKTLKAAKEAQKAAPNTAKPARVVTKPAPATKSATKPASNSLKAAHAAKQAAAAKR